MLASVSIVDVGLGNITSIRSAVARLGLEADRATTAEEVARARKLILPGVGQFGTAKHRLRASGLYGALDEAVRRRAVPILGICLGLHLMCAGSEEGNEAGFGWFDARVVRLRAGKDQVRVPHIAWNRLEVAQHGRLLRGTPTGSEGYFAHAYHLEAVTGATILATTHHGYSFPSAVERGNVYGTQFHPEKSGETGLVVLRNFLAA